MKRALVYIAMLAIIIAASPISPSMAGGSHDVDIVSHMHADMTASLLSDALNDCCSVDDNKMQHTGNSCSMDCHNAIAVASSRMSESKISLNGVERTYRIFSLSFINFRPPIII